MSATLHSHSVPVETLQRGFWLYILKVVIEGGTWHYVGRTGDNGHLTACDPFSRLAMHIRTSHKADSIIDKYNKIHGKERASSSMAKVQSVDLHCYGPIRGEVYEDYDGHHERRKMIARLENTLIQSMRDAGYNVFNKPGRDRDCDPENWKKVRASFSAHFPELMTID